MPRSKQQSEKMRAESREKIMDTGRRQFAENGFEGCSMQTIAKVAGMSKGNLYWYFSSKEELFIAILNEGFETLGSMMSADADPCAPGLERFNRFLDGFLGIMKDEEGQQFISIVFNFLAHGGVKRLAEMGIFTGQIGSNYHAAMNMLFKQCQAEGSIQPGVDPDLLSMYFFSFINGLVFMYPGEWQKLRDEDLRLGVYRLLGVREAPGGTRQKAKLDS